MAEEEIRKPSNNMVSYVLGGVLVIAVVTGGYFLRPKAPAGPAGEQSAMTPVATPTPGMITKLSCGTQYYNPVIGFTKYYLSVEGGGTEGASEVTCTTTVTQENEVVATEKVSVPLTANAARGGLVFTCSTPALELKPTIPTKVDIKLQDDNDATASCSTLFALPAP
ncbi:MAG: hypothetical protein UY10_C0043G0012 [Microgenomates group bacterium GW2011_GWA2_47_8]|nr:MAG: hypothetical protein UY10_C0043G0012 [Microgenomates group bacterium GW2011_GWA2_47_8]